MANSENDKLVWRALEYEERERSRDWFWALGVIVVTSSIAAIIFENYFFAALLVLAGVLLGFYATKKPELVTYELNPQGLVIHNRLYPYETMRSFWVQQQDTAMNLRPLLFVHTARFFMPVFVIPIEAELAEHIHAIFTAQNIEEVPMREHLSDKIMEMLGF